jgi:hypothetical protein
MLMDFRSFIKEFLIKTKETLLELIRKDEWNEFLDLLEVQKEYVPAKKIVKPIYIVSKKDRLTLRNNQARVDYSVVEQKEVEKEKYFIEVELKTIEEDFSIDLSWWQDYNKLNLPFDKNLLINEFEEILAAELKARKDMIWETLVYILKQHLDNDIVNIDGQILATPFRDLAGNTYPRVNGNAVVSGNWSNNAINPIQELLNLRTAIETQKIIENYRPKRFLVLMSQNTWIKFINNQNTQLLLRNWGFSIENIVSGIDVKKYQRKPFHMFLNAFADIEIYVQDPRLYLTIGGTKMPLIPDDKIYMIAIIPENFQIYYNNSEARFVGTDMDIRLYDKPTKPWEGLFELYDMTIDNANVIKTHRNFKLVGAMTFVRYFSHTIAYLNIT